MRGERKTLSLLLPSELHEQLEIIAESEHRSKNAQVTRFLESAIRQYTEDRAIIDGRTQFQELSEEDRERAMERMR